MCEYIIITPAFNEDEFIESPLKSVCAQSLKPLRWVVVDDGSTDNTADVVASYACENPFIVCYKRVKPPGQAYFASNVFAIMEGYEQVRDLSFDYVAILDADISLPRDYYEKVLSRFEQDDRLGIASGVYENLIEGKLHPVLNDRRSTPKALQVFRREVFEQIGGFVPMKHGGEDTVACAMARMKGWKTWSFPDIKAVHHRPTGMGNAKSILQARFRQGICEYGLATQPLFMLLKSLRRSCKERPYIIGGLVRLAGYAWAWLRRQERQIPGEAAEFLRREQFRRVVFLNRVPKENRVSEETYECHSH